MLAFAVNHAQPLQGVKDAAAREEGPGEEHLLQGVQEYREE